MNEKLKYVHVSGHVCAGETLLIGGQHRENHQLELLPPGGIFVPSWMIAILDYIRNET